MRRSVLCVAAALLLAGCTVTESASKPGPTAGPVSGPAPELRLVAYASCDELLASVRAAAKAAVRPWGFDFGGYLWATDGGMPAAGRAELSDKGAPAHSGTNTHEAGVDEPDIVKTDGRRIVTVLGETLRVIDPATRLVTGSLHVGHGSHQLFLQGDRALVLSRSWGVGRGLADAAGASRISPSSTRVRLVDLAGPPRITGTYEIGAQLTDARLVGGVARVVVSSQPRIDFPWREMSTDAERLAANRKIIDRSPLESWLPAYTSEGVAGRLDCGDVSRPDRFSGTSTVTVLSFDLNRPQLGDGLPVGVLADAETVYGNGPHLYLAHDERWRGEQASGRTELYQFDVTGTRPVFAASGSVPGWLLNQYSLSEHDGVLRAATTTGRPWESTARSESTVYTLRRDGGQLRPVGKLGGLGKGERIYAVRFLGPVGYVVTFRQTDPLYAVDLSDPARPRLTGELKIPGYSSYLHPLDGGRLLGVGQDATGQGRVTGLQVSLFDVGGADPKRLDQEKIPHGWSEAEHDPHAFLYWPDTRMLVVPYAAYDGDHRAGALVYRVGADRLEKIGEVTGGEPAYPRRSLVVGDTLWIVGDTVAVATPLAAPGPALARVLL
ncbi:beta-propeller domain-containing protein [Catellatospora sp. NPDC049609]|uniref:beta-propeller domain-containing protein n=1 Tax=Catellatospora sp. NPDC049609 TaxID=3155505 RepID=UPI0034255827